jgi:hypothetical protein
MREEGALERQKNVLGPAPGVDVMAKRPQGRVQCEDRLPYYKGSSCSLPLLLSMMSSNNRGDQKNSLWWILLSMELAMHNGHVSTANFITSQSRDPTSLAQKRCY